LSTSERQLIHDISGKITIIDGQIRLMQRFISHADDLEIVKSEWEKRVATLTRSIASIEATIRQRREVLTESSEIQPDK